MNLFAIITILLMKFNLCDVTERNGDLTYTSFLVKAPKRSASIQTLDTFLAGGYKHSAKFAKWPSGIAARQHGQDVEHQNPEGTKIIFTFFVSLSSYINLLDFKLKQEPLSR